MAKRTKDFTDQQMKEQDDSNSNILQWLGKLKKLSNEEFCFLYQIKKRLETYTPMALVEYLDQYVMGQEEAKRAVAVAVYNHLKRVLINTGILQTDAEFSDVVINKNNTLMLGNTGTGKTFILQTIANLLELPIYIGDASSLTAAGYAGNDVESLVDGLVRAADGDIAKAKYGIVVIDEIDKLAHAGMIGTENHDVGGECVQQSLLKILEGSTVSCTPNDGRARFGEKYQIDTADILFFGLGAFSGLTDQVLKRLNKNCGESSIGFKGPNIDNSRYTEAEALDNVTPDDLHKYGLIPEFIGRFPIITHTNALTVDTLTAIISNSKKSLLNQYQKLLSIDGINLQMHDDAKEEIAKIAIAQEVGARGLRSIMEQVLQDAMFDATSAKGKKYVITANYVRKVMGITDSLQ